MDGFGEQLTSRWTAPKDSDGPQDLTDPMSEEVFSIVLHRMSEDVLEGGVENLYTLLIGNETTEGMRVQAESTLQSRDIDVDQLLPDFISHQAVYTCLASIRDVSKDFPSGDRVGNITGSIQRLYGRLVTVIERGLGSLCNTSKLQLDDFDVFVDTQVCCRGCGAQYEVAELLQRGGCDCDESRSNY